MRALLLAALASRVWGLEIVTAPSPSPLVRIKVMVKAGSAHDPAGKEGLARLSALMLIQGGFGDPVSPVTKERLAELTRPWGSGAYPSVRVARETATFSATVPKERFVEYARTVLGPMFQKPLFAPAELGRIKAEALQALVSDLRLEEVEPLGLAALDAFMHEGSSYAHPELGTEAGLAAVTVSDVRAFHRARYRSGAVIAGASSDDPEVLAALRAALDLPSGAGRRAPAAEPAFSGREALVVSMPNTIATGVHLGSPLAVRRGDPGYWPLYVANVWLGTHRDGFSRLYELIRAQRGYNYGDYSYIEHFEGRPRHLFPPFNVPRRSQYFSIWVRPVGHEYAAHVVKAITWELEDLVRRGLSAEDCAAAKNKAKVLYLNLAETSERILEAKVDDAFHGLKPGWLDGYLASVESVSCADVKDAFRRSVDPASLRYVLVTGTGQAAALAAQLGSDAPAWGKKPEDYQIDVSSAGGRRVYSVPEDKLEVLRRDAVWAHHPTGLTPARVRAVPSEKLFESAGIPR